MIILILKIKKSLFIVYVAGGKSKAMIELYLEHSIQEEGLSHCSVSKKVFILAVLLPVRKLFYI